MAKRKTETTERTILDTLTEKEKAFCKSYVNLGAQKGIGTAAALQAGYAESSAASTCSRLLRQKRIIVYVKQLQDRAGIASGIDVEFVLAELHKVYERCMQTVEALDKSGNPTGEFVFDAANARASLEAMGKHLGMFIDRKLIEDHRAAAPSTERLSTDDFMRVVSKRAAANAQDADDPAGQVEKVKH